MKLVSVFFLIFAVRQITGVFLEAQVAMPVTVILLVPCQKPAMNLMVYVNVRKAFEAGNAMNVFLTLTRAIKFITGFQQGANMISVAGIKTITIYQHLKGYLTLTVQA